TGTGNTLLIAESLADELTSGGKSVSIVAMERFAPDSRSDDAALGLAMPVACFSTYPTVWRFIDSLPAGGGREAFLIATMGGAGGGMDGPVRRALEAKGYRPIGSCIVKMPRNYSNRTIDAEENSKRERLAKESVKIFAHKLLDGSARWSTGVPVISNFAASLAHGRKPWNFFYRLFPLAVAGDKCDACGLCQKLCPEGNITVDGGKASIGNLCQSCQRCIGFCPIGAIHVPGKPAVQYRGIELESILSLLGK
ncbi:MAG: EFR1 family ferrodoxin, partial [Synergistaceae bacterium]|nr:EFR1 family ferrodoxin [Synergistaceae bacterium]